MLSARPVRGAYRRLRWAANAALIAILLAVPWIRIGGEPLVLLDIPARRFHVLGLLIFPQELYFLWLIVAGLGVALFFFTSVAGRLWCGWACPQTVFTDVFAAVARRLQRWSRAGPPRHVAPWRKVATHAVWVLLSVVVGFHVVGYFRSPYVLLSQLGAGTLSPKAAGFLVVVSGLCYFDFAILRQTFCKYLCPYARFQSVLFDRDTLVIGYDALRGEPRGKPGGGHGDCVDCGLCVAVCPTEIDIRKGLQMECIACTQCIDACNGVMDRLGREPGLIDYRSLVGLERIRPVRILRTRVVIYAALLVAVGVAFSAALATRVPLDLQVSHNAAALYHTTADGRLGNAFTLHIQNRDRVDHAYHLRLEAPEGFELLAGVNPIPVGASRDLEARVFVVSRPEDSATLNGPQKMRFVLEQVGAPGRRVERAANFLAPRS